jgi:adenylate cyclase
MNEERARRKLSGILSADAVGYSRLMQKDEESTIRALADSKELMAGLIQRYRGRVVDAPGDNLLAEFGSVVDAAECAVKIQEELNTRNAELPRDKRMDFRIGVNLGDVVEEGGRIYGDGVNIAARLERLAAPGGICISGIAFDQVKNKLKLGYEDLGAHSVKNIAEPVQVYKVLLEPEYAGKVIAEKKPKSRTFRNAAFSALALIVLVIGAMVIWNNYFRVKIEPASLDKMAYPLPDKPSIAVLPFDNLSGDPKQAYFCDGISEGIITALSKIPKLFVIARHSSFVYKNKAVKVQQVSEELGVQFVIEGSVQIANSRLRITAQLIDALKGHHIWSEKYDRRIEDLFKTQDAITKEIITSLQVELTEGEAARIYSKGTDNLDAYLKVMQANWHALQHNKDDILKARKLAEEAIDLDPQYAVAYRVLGITHQVAPWLGLSKSPKESFSRAIQMAKKAVALDETFASAHGFLGYMYAMTRQHDRALVEGERAYELSPTSADVLFAYGATLFFSGQFEKANQMLREAIRLNPVSPNVHLIFLAATLREMGQYEKAIAISQTVLARDPKNDLAHLTIIASHIYDDQIEVAREKTSEFLEIYPNFSLSRYEKILPYKNQAVKKRYIDALRKAGLSEHPPLKLPDKPSIAVLAFVNLSGDPEQEYFSDGVSEEIITALSKTPKLFVIARTSSFKYKGKEVDVRTVGRELGVRYVLEGSVRRAGDKVRITAQLIDAQTNHHLWAERYDRRVEDIFSVQDEITMKIITAMEVKLTEGEQAAIQARGAKELDAYLKYLQARENLRRINRADTIQASKLAEEIINLDPDYPGGYRILAFVEINSVWFGWSKSPKESLMRAIKMAKKALEIEDSSNSHRVLAYTYVLFRKHDEAIKEARTALEMEPNSADAHNDLGHVLFQSDLAQEAVPVLKKAIRLNPYPPSMYFHNLAWAYHSLGKYEEAVRVANKAIQVNPKDIVAHRALVSAYSLLGREADARVEAAEVLEIDPNFSVDRFAKISPFKNQDKAKKIWDSYRKAGLK